MNFLHWLFLVLALVFLGAPLIIKSFCWIAAEIEFVPTLPEDLSETGRAGVEQIVRDLLADGFVVISNTRAIGGVNRVKGTQMIFAHPQRRDMAFGMSSTTSLQTEQQIWAVSFRTYFQDGTHIETVSSPILGVFPADSKVDRINVSWIKNLNLLYFIHRARVDNSPHSLEERVLPRPGSEIEFQKQEWREVLQRVASARYIRLDETGTIYWMTFMGAYIMTWRQMWPFTVIRHFAYRRKALRVLRKLGFTESGAFRLN